MSSIRVLLIEDDERARIDLADTLLDRGFETASVASAEDAMILLGAGQIPDVLVTEINPRSGLDARNLAELARARRPEVEVVYLGGGQRPEETTGFGAHDWVMAKPFSLDDLLAVIRRAQHAEVCG
jgi:DNA-binding NtrC family response regulator